MWMGWDGIAGAATVFRIGDDIADGAKVRRIAKVQRM